MKTEKKILVAFVLNLAFSVFEFLGGVMTGSVAILSDAVHDLGDAAGIGISYSLERKSKRQPDGKYTFGYARYSVAASLLTTGILLLGSAVVVWNAVRRLIHPVEINYTGMMVFAGAGVCVNLGAAFFTRGGDSLNQKAVNLHMLEDVMGWAVVLVGAVMMRWTDWARLDSILSIGVAGFILVHGLRNGMEALAIFLEKTPRGLDPAEVKEHLMGLAGVLEVHHIHLWSIDGQYHCATLHVVAEGEPGQVKERVREELREHGIGHVTMELEVPGEVCLEKECHVEPSENAGHHHHHH